MLLAPGQGKLPQSGRVSVYRDSITRAYSSTTSGAPGRSFGKIVSVRGLVGELQPARWSRGVGLPGVDHVLGELGGGRRVGQRGQRAGDECEVGQNVTAVIGMPRAPRA